MAPPVEAWGNWRAVGVIRGVHDECGDGGEGVLDMMRQVLDWAIRDG